MTVRVRFAPSPTGYLHIGNIRAALINWLFAKKHKGTFLLRMDDTDQERSTQEYEDQIFQDLSWLGLTHDDFLRQSDRFDRYDAVRDQLIRTGRLYPCYETPEELEFKRRRQLGKGQPPRYDREALTLTDAQKKAFCDAGRTPHYRFKLEDKDVSWTDLVRGPVHFHSQTLSDPVLVKGDGNYLYTLTSVVDDIDTDITHILRGEDHVTNTAVQIQLFEALGHDPASIHFGHTSLLMDKDGGGLSKRLGTLGIKDLKEEGIDAITIISLLARLGTSLPIQPFASIHEVIRQFDLEDFGRNPPRFDKEELVHLQHKILTHLPFEHVQAKLAAKGLTKFSTSEWDLIKGNITCDDDLHAWHEIFHAMGLKKAAPAFSDEDMAYFKVAAALLPHEQPFTPNTWGTWTTALKNETGRKGKSLFMPLRQALTGYDHGPEMRDILQHLSYETVIHRLKNIR